MSSAMKLQERVSVPRTAWKLADIFILCLLFALLSCRVASLREGGASVAALVCEAWFTFVWILNMNIKWNPVRFNTYPENLSQRTDELPAVDMLVTTADPELEPPLMTVNTVLSLLAVDYPDVDKLACYVSDDGCSPVTCYALREAARFARLWVPFCKRHGVGVRAPFMYFASSRPEPELAGDWTFIKSEYDKLVSRIESADEGSLLRHDDAADFTEFKEAKRGDHPAIVKVLWDNSKSSRTGSGDGFPNLVYVSREKTRKHDHHYKAGAMNVLARVSAVMTNAPIILNMDCDMFVNNPQVVLHAMCLLLGFNDETCSGFVQVPQRFYAKLKDDPFGNQIEVLREKLLGGLSGLQGIYYLGTGCFHRRKIIYGVAPPSFAAVKHERQGSLTYEDLRTKFGASVELAESARNIYSREIPLKPMIDISSRIQVAKQVSSCNYETGTHWGQEIGWSYGSMAEDILTGQRIHSAGWKSTSLDTNPPAFLGCAPTGGPASLTQYKRWATGLLEILLGPNTPIIATIFKRLQFRQYLGYLVFYVWSMRAPFELCYALLGPFCLFRNHSFLLKASNHGFSIQLALFLSYNIYNFVEYMECGLSARTWWNNMRMQRIVSLSSWLLAFLSVVLKTIGLSKTVFEVTRKDKSTSDGDPSTHETDLGWFTFDSSPVFIPMTAVAILNIVTISIGVWRHAIFWMTTGNHDCQNIGEFLCCGLMILYFWPFIKGLVGRGRYGIPWNVKLKAWVIVVPFLYFCGGD
ncbi:cellulose synthase-like protein H1 [Triticum dicoccoides]|uniref:cellulose synthase-like protein H1 n=1 Tax=Triticum dicoccoides TaxID=85692 RepID=UPI0018900396|nr:cellulose synthase-like protein H1 [Triticum dicoccoides]